MNNINNDRESLSLQKKLDCMISELQKGLINDLYWLFEASSDHNAIIHIGESPNVKSFKVHTSVLSARSLYFRAILSSDRCNSKNSLIEITQANIKPDVFDIILKFLYTGRIPLENERNVEKILECIIAAERLWLYPLMQYIENFLLINMHDWLRSNFVHVLITTKLYPSSFKSLHKFVDNILKNHSHLLFNSNDFYKLPESILTNLLQKREFSKDITEEKIWDVVLDWGIKQDIDLFGKDIRDWTTLDFSKLQISLQRCVPLIRFTNISPDVFFDKVDPYNTILTSGIYEKIMQSPTFVVHKKLSVYSFSEKTSPTFSKPTQQHSRISEILQEFPKPPSITVTQPNRTTPSPTKKPINAIKRALSLKKSDVKRQSNSSNSSISSISSPEEPEFTISEPTKTFKSFEAQINTSPLIIRKAKGSLNRQTSIISSRSRTTSSSDSSYLLF